MSLKKVAVIGGSGNLGPAIVKSLLDTGFTVSVLTRVDSKATFPSGVKVYRTDYDSPSSLAEAFAGQDAVVSTISSAAVGQQDHIIDAAVKAGVKRFIPSEFGINTNKATGGIAKILNGKLVAREQLKKAAAENPNFSWTAIATSLFFDWGLKFGTLGFSAKDKTATIYDSGNEPFTGSNLPHIGLAVAAVLKNPDKTANKYIEVASFLTTQNDILDIFQKETGVKWTVVNKNTSDSLKLADEKLAKGDYSAFIDYLKVELFKDGAGKSPKLEELANEELGLSLEDLTSTLKSVL